MSESRRELFRTSIITAIGAAAGVVGGYKIATDVAPAPPSVPPYKGSVIAVRDNNKGWYLFHFEADRQLCRLYQAGTAPSATDETKIDTTTWLGVCGTLVTENTPITYTKADHTDGSLQINLNSAGYVEDDTDNSSLKNLLNAIASESYLPNHQIPGSWNEIGHN